MSCSKNFAIDKVCSKCGSVGYAEYIATCFVCKRISEHTYCMQKLRRNVPTIWHCEDCVAKSKKKIKKRQTILLEGKHIPEDATLVKRSCPLNRGASKQLNGSAKQRPGTIRTTPNSRAIRTIPASPASKASVACSQIINRATSAGVHHALSKLAAGAGSHEKKGNANEHKTSGKKTYGAFCSKEPLEKTVGPRSQHSPLNDITVSNSNCATVLRCQSNVEERMTMATRTLEEAGRKALLVKKNLVEGCRRAESRSNETGLGSNAYHDAGISKPYGSSDSRFEKHGRQDTDSPQKSVSTLDGMHRHHPIPRACWKGDFKILDMISSIGPEIQGIQAHTPDVVSSNVHEIVKELSGKVEIELHSCVDLWPKLFQLDPPDLGDIGLYFFPSKEQRLKETFKCLVDMMDKQGLAMQSRFQNAELLIFTSAKLTQDPYVMGVVPEVFLWGVFRRRRPQRRTTTDKGKLPFNSPTTSGNANSGQNNSGSSFRLRAEGMTIARTNRPDGPPGFSEAIYRNQAQRGRQAVTSTLVIDSRAADVPLGFSGPVCPPKRK